MKKVKEKMFIYLVGPHGVGKSCFTGQLSKKFNILHIDTGPIIRSYHREANTSLSLGEWVQEKENSYGINFTNNLLLKHIQKMLKDTTEDIVIITGNRSLNGILYLNNDVAPNTKPCILYLDANKDLLKNNWQIRENRIVSNEEFDQILLDEIRQGLDDIKKYVKNNPESCIYLEKKDNENTFIEQRVVDFLNNRTISRFESSKREDYIQ
jgi:adenylate kinase family enzyme